MSGRNGEYVRCKKCKELVTDADDCANCAARAQNPYAFARTYSVSGKRGSPTLDIQERNLEEPS